MLLFYMALLVRRSEVRSWGEDIPPGLSWRSDPVKTLSDLTVVLEVEESRQQQVQHRQIRFPSSTHR